MRCNVIPYRGRLAILIAWWLVPGLATPAMAQSRLSVKPTYGNSQPWLAQRSLDLPPVEPPSASSEADPRPLTGGPQTPSSSTEPLPANSLFYFGEPQTSGPAAVQAPLTVDPGDQGEPMLEATPMLDDWSMGGEYIDEEAAPIYSTGTWFRRGNWRVNLDYVYWTQKGTRSQILAADIDTAQGANNRVVQTLSTTDTPLRFEPGMRLSVARFVGRDAGHRDHLFEFTFLGLFNWSSDQSLECPPDDPQRQNCIFTLLNNFFFNPQTGQAQPGLSDPVIGFFGVNEMAFRYETDLNSYEWNYLVQSRPGRDQMALQPDGTWVRFKNSSVLNSWHLGLRLMMIDDAATLTAQSLNGAQRGFYQVLTNNDLFGPHFGVERVESFDRWSWGLRTRLGALGNLIDSRSNYVGTDAINTIRRQQKVTTEQLSFAGEFGLFGLYQLRPNLALRGGYDVMYLTGLSVGSENLGLEPTFPDLNSTGDTLFHGGMMGIEAIW